MLYELLLLTISALALFVAGLLAYTFVTNELTVARFKKQSRGIPIIGDKRPFGNHILSWSLRKNLCPELVRAHAEIGKTFGWMYNNNPAVSTIDLDFIKKIHDEPNKHTDRVTINFPLGEFEHSIMLAKGNQWRKLRRYFAPALKSNKFKTPNVIREIECSIEKLIGMIDYKLNELDKQETKVNIDDLVHRYSLNLVFSCFYKQYNLINFDENQCRWTTLMDQGLETVQTSPFVHASLVFPILRPVIDWLSYHFHSQGAWRRDIMTFVKMQTHLGMEARKHAQHLKTTSVEDEKPDLDNFILKDGTKFSRNMIDHVIDQFLDGKLTKDEFLNTSCFLVAAADKTAADCLVFTLYQLAHRPKIQEKLRNSIMEAGADSEYLAWVLNEALRLMPSVPVGGSRTVTHEFEIEGGYRVPKDTFVITPSYVIHRLKEYWGEDAEEFKPERWHDTSNHHPMQYMPFGVGPRSCLGKDFALFEMKMLLSALLTRYTFECKPKDDLYVFDSPFLVFLIPNSPTYITIKRLKEE